jgi:hypothetical protein
VRRKEGKMKEEKKVSMLFKDPQNTHNTLSEDGAFYFYCQPPPKELSK